MTKTNEQRTKRKRQQEAKAVEDRKEIDDFLREQFAATVKAREIVEEYLNGEENTGERQRK